MSWRKNTCTRASDPPPPPHPHQSCPNSQAWITSPVSLIIHSFIHLWSNHFFSTYYLPGPSIQRGYLSDHRLSPCLSELTGYWGDSQQTNRNNTYIKQCNKERQNQKRVR